MTLDSSNTVASNGQSIPSSLSSVSSSIPTATRARVSRAEMEQAVRTLLIGLGEDPDREGLKDTPKRVVKALQFLTQGYDQSLEELLNGAVFHEDTDEMVLNSGHRHFQFL